MNLKNIPFYGLIQSVSIDYFYLSVYFNFLPGITQEVHILNVNVHISYIKEKWYFLTNFGSIFLERYSIILTSWKDKLLQEQTQYTPKTDGKIKPVFFLLK